MRIVAIFVGLAWVFDALGAQALADGGAVRLVHVERGYRLSVFTLPNPPRAGPVDLSVLVQDAASGAPVTEGTIDVSLIPRGQPDTVVFCAATSAAATNKLFRSARVELRTAGWWDVEIACETPRGPIRARFSMEAAAALPRLPALWPWVSWPFAVVVLFGVHRWLVCRKEGSALCELARNSKN